MVTKASLAIDRTLVFISHATPQDNDFVLWLGARLASSGYLIWSDLTKLIGGETHWDNIASAIRDRSIKFISVCSAAAFPKNGWKDELSLALSVERTKELGDFVIPVRLDGTPWSEFPVEIIRRNGIDFHGGWQTGLGRLLKKLDADAVPKKVSVDTTAISQWSSSLLNMDGDLAYTDETLVSNVVEILESPKAMIVSRLRYGASAPPSELMRWPAELKQNWAYSFARLDQSEDGLFAPASQLELGEFVTRGDPQHGLTQQEAYNIAANLLRQQVSKAIASRGLSPCAFANGGVGHFLPAQEQEISPRVRFTDPWGVPESRALNGYSPKNKVFWHFAPEISIQVGRTLSASCHSHVVFTEDGCNVIDDAKLAHRLRRRFCKNWWQDRWRGMTLAYLSYLADGKALFDVPLSDTVTMSLSLSPTLFISPVTASSPDLGTEDVPEDVEIDVDDEFDVDEEDDEDDEDNGNTL